jgi:hypothetical protein
LRIGPVGSVAMVGPGRRSRSILPVAGGILAAVALVGGAYLMGSAPQVLVPGGTAETVPAYENHTAAEGGFAACFAEGDCGHAGVLEVGFNLSGPAALTGSLEIPAPLTLALANPAGLDNLSPGWWWPPSDASGAFAAGGEAVTFSNLSGLVNLGDLSFGLAGASDVLPGGSWTLCLVNWSTTPVDATVVSALTESPR